MRTIGTVIKDTRVKKRYSKSRLEEITRIKRGFLEALEGENWERLPEYPVLQGFVNNISGALDLDKKQMIALLRRDYPPKTLRINPKPDIPDKFSWSPRLTFLLGIFIVTTAILGYLIFQYVSFITPPKLAIDSPVEGQIVKDEKLKVAGTVDSQASVSVNNQPALIDDMGNFSATIEIFEGTREVLIVAKSRSGKETIIRRTIKPELNN